MTSTWDYRPLSHLIAGHFDAHEVVGEVVSLHRQHRAVVVFLRQVDQDVVGHVRAGAVGETNAYKTLPITTLALHLHTCHQFFTHIMRMKAAALKVRTFETTAVVD